MRPPVIRGKPFSKQILTAMAAILLLAAVLTGAIFILFRPGGSISLSANSQTGQTVTPVGKTSGIPPVSAMVTVQALVRVSGKGTPTTGNGNQEAPVAVTATAPGPRLPLAGHKIGLDPGHGPRGDLGAVLVNPNTGKLILSEAEFNLDVSLRCRDLLRARGASVVLTRESADTFTAPWPADANSDGIVGGSKDDLQVRTDILNTFDAEVFLSIHANNAPRQSNAQGVQAFYCATSDCAFPAEGKRLGGLVLGQLRTQLAAVGYPVQSAQLHADTWMDGLHFFLLGPVKLPEHVRATKMPGALAESLYLNSPAEAAQLQKDSVRQAVALAYANALEKYLTGSADK